MSSKDETVVNSGHTSAAPTISSSDVYPENNRVEKADPSEERWKPGKKEWAVMITFVISNMVVALESSILVTVLPV